MRYVTALAAFLFSLSMALTAQPFVKVKDGRFMRNEKPYYFVGANMWYAPILASEGRGGNLSRLVQELDTLQAIGVTNLRILMGADAGSSQASCVSPVLQKAPGQMNDTLLAGMDRLLVEMAKRDMTAVIYLNNAWDWSGGYGFYLQNTGHGESPASDGEGYASYVKYASAFSTDKAAQALFFDYIRCMAGRTNALTGIPYREDPTIMAWQICNEPRPFSNDSATLKGFKEWVTQAAHILKETDPNHLVSVGSEGIIGCGQNAQLYQQLHIHPDIDYLTLHIWPLNWNWSSRDRLYEALPNVYVKSEEYISQHEFMAKKLNKPMVIEEFGYARDKNFLGTDTPTRARDSFYGYVFSKLADSATGKQSALMGINFWGWGGSGRPTGKQWKQGQDYLSDPPHEPQGWYSVFDTDQSTLQIIRHTAHVLKSQE